MYPETFELTEDHIKLINRMYVDFCDEGYDGAPAVNLKRPYGNSYVIGDLYEIVHDKEAPDDPYGEISEEEQERLMELHRETAIALQIVLSTLKFEPGLYYRPGKYERQKWKRLVDISD